MNGENFKITNINIRIIKNLSYKFLQKIFLFDDHCERFVEDKYSYTETWFQIFNYNFEAVKNNIKNLQT